MESKGCISLNKYIQMDVKEKYTQEEWDLLSGTPMLLGAAMSGAGSSGIMGTAKEAFANTQAMMGAGESYPGNALIAAVATKPSSMSEAREKSSQQRELLMGRMKERGIQNASELVELVVDDCRKVAFLLGEKEDVGTANEYKQWLLSIGEKVANAASEGGFLGFGGTRFSEEEKVFLAQVNEALGMEPTV